MCGMRGDYLSVIFLKGVKDEMVVTENMFPLKSREPEISGP